MPVIINAIVVDDIFDPLFHLDNDKSFFGAVLKEKFHSTESLDPVRIGLIVFAGFSLATSLELIECFIHKF